MRIPGYAFDAKLYEGSSTIVYAGLRESDGAAVVAKVIVGAARDLRIELAMAQRVAGEGVVEALGVYDSTDGPALVERRFGDLTVAKALAAGRFSAPRALGVSLQLARVLTRMHRARILHRDIKPSNILLDSSTDRIALADFGVAVELPLGTRSLPVADFVGTPAYIGPEQTGRTREGCDNRSDLDSWTRRRYGGRRSRLPRHGGTLSVQSTSGTGTVWRFSFGGHLAKAPRGGLVRRTQIAGAPGNGGAGHPRGAERSLSAPPLVAAEKATA